jgi:hypothetical protein
MRHVRDLTIRDLGLLAEDVWSLPRLSAEYAQVNELMGLAAVLLQNTGAPRVRTHPSSHFPQSEDLAMICGSRWRSCRLRANPSIHTKPAQFL